jgi:hypothetical protein
MPLIVPILTLNQIDTSIRRSGATMLAAGTNAQIYRYTPGFGKVNVGLADKLAGDA